MDRYTHAVMEDQLHALHRLPDLSEAALAEGQATGTDDRILLGHLLGQKGAIRADSSRPIQTLGGMSCEQEETQKSLVNKGDSASCELVRAAGLEPATRGLKGRCSAD